MDQAFYIILCTSLHIFSIGLVMVARKWVRHQLAAVVINYTRTINAGVDLLELDYSISKKQSYGGDHCLIRSPVFVHVCKVEHSSPFMAASAPEMNRCTTTAYECRHIFELLFVDPPECDHPSGDLHYCLQLLGGIVCVHRLVGRLSQRLLRTSFFKSRNKLDFLPRKLVAALSSLALMKGFL